MLTVLELLFVAVVIVFVVQCCKRKYSNRNCNQENNDTDTTDTIDVESPRQSQSQRRRSRDTPPIDLEARRELVCKNLFTKSISSEKSVTDLARLLAISRGATVDEELGCDQIRDELGVDKYDELTLNSTNSELEMSSIEPSAPPLTAEDDVADVIDNTSTIDTTHGNGEAHAAINEYKATTIWSAPPQNPEDEHPASLRNLITNLTHNVTKRLSYYPHKEEKRLECSICLEHFEPNDTIGWAKDGGDPTPISGADTGCDHIFHQKCLMSWLERHDDCPLCRRKVVHANAEVRFAGWDNLEANDTEKMTTEDEMLKESKLTIVLYIAYFAKRLEEAIDTVLGCPLESIINTTMSSESTDLAWGESIKELQTLVEIERNIVDSSPISIDDAQNHFAKLYCRYSIVLSKLNKVYEATVQPQKRLDIRSTLIHVICRVINLRHLLVKWAPPNPDVLTKDGTQQPFSWEYADLDRTLRELHAAPSHLSTDTPSMFNEEGLKSRRERDAFILKLLREKYGDVLPTLEEKEWPIPSSKDVGATAINETSAEFATSGDMNEGCHHSSDDESESDTDTLISDNENTHELAATKIQANFRRHIDQIKANKVRQWVSTFIGMKSDYTNQLDRSNLIKNLEDVNRKRKQEQTYCREKYEQDLTRLKDVVKDEEGFRMEVDLREERIKWITDQVVRTNAIPDSLEGFYAKDIASTEINEVAKDPKAKDNKKKDGDDKKSKDKGKETQVEIEVPSLAAPPTMLDSITESIHTYDSRWKQRNTGPNRVRSQYHDEELAKNLIIRDQVKSELTKEVEEKLMSNLLKIKALEDADKKKSKSKKETKGKKGKSKKAGGKGKKEKPLPGAKLPGMKDMKVEEMIQELVDHGLICNPAQHVLNDFIGGYECQPPKVTESEDNERWIPLDPSAFQLKRSIYDYCILPLGSEEIKDHLQDKEHVRSLLFYGPEGSGKTLLAQAIASELGALLINLSSTTIGDSFGEKESATRLVHMAFSVAKEKSYGPVVIYLDDCHEFFMGKAKKGASINIKADLKRFQKDLLIYKNQSLTKEDRVLIIGCTNRPDLADVKLLRWKGSKGKPEKQGFFERSLYCPRANHADRSMLWRKFIQKKISSRNSQQEMSQIDFDALAVLSDGFSAAEIASIVNVALSEDRLQDSTRSLIEQDFTCHLSPRKPTDDIFLAFTRQITELDARVKAIKAPATKKKK